MEEDIEELKRLFYANSLTQYGKRKLINYYEQRYKKLEEENKQLRIDNTDKLCEECSELVKQAGITKEDTNRILKEYRDRVENSIPTSVIQKYKEKFLKDSKNEKVFMTQSTQINASLISFCDELLEERKK